MRWWHAVIVLALAAVEAAAQPRPAPRVAPPAVDGAIRIESNGNDLVAGRAAPVAWESLDRMVVEIRQPPGGNPAVRVVRAWPRQRLDYALGVTREGTLLLGERVHVFDAGRGEWVFDRGEIARAYPALERNGDWTWLVDFSLSRDRTVTLEVRAPARWPVARVTLEAAR